MTRIPLHTALSASCLVGAWYMMCGRAWFCLKLCEPGDEADIQFAGTVAA